METLVNTSNPRISVIMLTYNRERFVGRMIECILKQTFHNFEFIIVDNGSNDHSGKIADYYAMKDRRIEVIHREQGNIGSGRNTGLDRARGSYIAFVDDDDTCMPDFLEFLYNLAEETESDIAICGASWSDIDEKRVMNAEQAMETLLWRKHFNVAFPTKLFRRELFEQYRFLENGKYDDIYLMPKMIAAANKVAYHGLSKYHFERHENNNSAWTQNHKLLDKETLIEYLEVYQKRTNWLIKRFPKSVEMWKYFNWSFMISMVDKVTQLELIDCYEIRNKLVLELEKNRDDFCSCPWILDIEKQWMRQYVIQIKHGAVMEENYCDISRRI